MPSDLPFSLKHVNFPIMPCFAISVHEEIGQSMKLLDLNLMEDPFSHGQLYLTCSCMANIATIYSVPLQKHLEIFSTEKH